MTSYLNNAKACHTKGSFAVGTGNKSNYQSNFIESVVVPKNPDGSIKDGYTLSSSSTSDTGVSWDYTGAGGKTIQTYQFPNNCPIPFPNPNDLKTDLVLITRENSIVGDSGLVDLYMPVVGIQGNIPRHSLPSVADPIKGVVFFFDDANAAINVYNVATKTWRMGWVRAVPGFDFVWRAADILSPDKIRVLNGTYAAPYNSEGIFFSCVSTQFTNSTNQTVQLLSNQSGFYFINYQVTDGEIVPWAPATAFHRTNGGLDGDTVEDWFVTAICVVNTKENIYYASKAINNNVPAPDPAFITKQFVCAVGIGNNSALTQKKYGWWGFLALTDANIPVLVNPDMSWATTGVGVQPYPNFAFWELVSGTDVPRGYVQTISLDPVNQYFFIGGNFSHSHFKNSVVSRSWTCTGGPYTQIGAVALQFKFSRLDFGGQPTIANYEFIGYNAAKIADCRPWTGRVAQSNYNDSCFAYGGNFTTPPSKVIDTANEGFNPFTDPFLTTTPNITNGLVEPYSNFVVKAELRSGYLDSFNILFSNDGTPFDDNANKSSLNNICVALAPSDGDIRQATFAPVIIGGNFLQPRAYSARSDWTFQSQNTVIGTDWWYSFIQIWVEADMTEEVTYRAYLYPDSDFNYLDSPIQFHGKAKWSKGRNIIPILGGGTKLTNPLGTSGGEYLNSNLNAATTQPFSFTPMAFFLRLIFTDSTDTNPKTVSLGINGANLKRWAGCWKLYGYPNDNITLENNPGLFSSVALSDAAYAEQEVPAGDATRRILKYYNLREKIPQSFISYFVFAIPINWQKDLALYTTYNDGSGQVSINYNVVQANYISDRQGDFDSSVLHLTQVPGTMYRVTNMNSSDVVLPSFSFYMNDRYEIYKTGWSYTDQVALGVFTSFQEVSDLQITVLLDNASVAGTANEGKASFNTGHTVLSINRYSPVGLLNYVGVLAVGDTIYIEEVGAANVGYYQINGAVTQTSAPDYVATVPVLYLEGYDGWGAVVKNTLFNYVLSRNPYQTPFILKDDLGPYVIGNGSAPDTVRDIYLSPYNQTGKAYRYIPAFEENFLQFDSKDGSETFIALGTPTIDSTVIANTVSFNSNSSSVLLSRSAGIAGGYGSYWNLVSSYGNVGFNTLIN